MNNVQTDTPLIIAIEALRKIEEGFRYSVHGNTYCYGIAKQALEEIEIEVKKALEELKK